MLHFYVFEQAVIASLSKHSLGHISVVHMPCEQLARFPLFKLDFGLPKLEVLQVGIYLVGVEMFIQLFG